MKAHKTARRAYIELRQYLEEIKELKKIDYQEENPLAEPDLLGRDFREFTFSLPAIKRGAANVYYTKI